MRFCSTLLLIIDILTLQISPFRCEVEECFKSFGLSIVTKDENAYAVDVQQFWTTGFLHRPQGFILVRNAVEVQKAIYCSRIYGANLAVKSGGHSFESYSLGCNDSWVINLRNLNEVAVNCYQRIVTFGSGLNARELEEVLWEKGFVLPLGTCNSVGVSGISLGGGIGLIQRKFGLTLDHIIELEIVTADGRIRTVSRKYEADLFWALRGAGGGNFGIVTKLTMKVQKPPKFVARITKTYAKNHAANIFYKWQKYFSSNETDNSLFSEFQFNGPGNMVARVNFVIAADSKAHSDKLIATMQTVFPNITSDLIKRYKNYIDVQYEISGEGDFPPNFLPICQKSANFFVSKQIDFAESRKLMEIVNGNGWIHVATFGGKISALKRDDTAWVHRTSKYNVLLNFNRSCDDSVNSGTSLYFKKFSFIDNGESYQNYVSRLQDDYLHRYYGSNLKRLIAVKNKYDPKNFFCFPQSIPLALDNPRHICSCDY